MVCTMPFGFPVVPRGVEDEEQVLGVHLLGGAVAGLAYSTDDETTVPWSGRPAADHLAVHLWLMICSCICIIPSRRRLAVRPSR